MLNFRKSLKTGIAALFVAITAFGAIVPEAMAQGRDRGDRNDRGDRGDRRDDRRDNNNRRDFDRGGRGNFDRDRGRNNFRPDWRNDRRWDGPGRGIAMRYRPPSYYRYYAMPRDRYYNNIRVWRPYGRPYTGFGFYYRDNDAARFLGLTALSFVALNALNESQQRAHEQAMIDAANARIGEPIYWNDNGRSGRVTAVRDGMTADGRQCREFQQEVTIDGRPQEAYGTACLQPDGSWEVVNDNG
jgi:hypothetical protein